MGDVLGCSSETSPPPTHKDLIYEYQAQKERKSSAHIGDGMDGADAPKPATFFFQNISVEIIIIIIIDRRSGITSHTSHGHKTWTRSMQPVVYRWK